MVNSFNSPSITVSSSVLVSKKDKNKYLPCIQHYAISNRLYLIVELLSNDSINNVPFSNFDFFSKIKNQYIDIKTKLKDTGVRDILKVDSLLLYEANSCPFQAFIKIFKQLSEREVNVIDSRIEGLTLEKVGGSYGVTRERIRQIEAKAMKSLSYVGNILCFRFMNVEGVLDFDFLNKKVISNGIDIKYITYILKKNDNLSYIPLLDKFIKKTCSSFEDTEKIISTHLGKVVINQLDILNLLEILGSQNIVYLSYGDIETYLLSKRYINIDNNYYNTRKVASPYLIMIHKYLNSEITLYQLHMSDDLKFITDKVVEYFPNHIKPVKTRSITMRIQDDMYRIDRSKYIIKSSIDLSFYNVDFVYEYIIESKIPTLFFNGLYGRFENQLVLEGVSNNYFLKTILEFKYGQEFDFSRDHLTKKDNNFVGFLERLETFILECRRPVGISEILKEFSYFPEMYINSQISRSKNILKYEFAYYIHRKFYPRILNETLFLDDLKNYLNTHSFITYEKFLEKLHLSNEYGLPFNHKNVASFIDNNFGKIFEIYDDLVFLEKSKYSILDRLCLYLNVDKDTEIHIDKIDLFFERNVQRDGVKRRFTNTVDSLMIRKNENTYYPVNFRISDEFIEKTKTILEKLFSEDSVNGISLLTPFDIIEQLILPYDELYWNEFTLISIIKNYFKDKFSYFSCNITSPGFPYGLVAVNDSNNSFSDIIVDYLIDLGVNEIDEIELKEFLRKKRIILNDIPYQFYNSERVEYNDVEMFFNLNKR